MNEIAPTVNLGGEGEIPGAINVNGRHILTNDWARSRDGADLNTVRSSGLVVIADPCALPFRNGSVDIKSYNTPISEDGRQTHLGPTYNLTEIQRVATPGSYVTLCSELVNTGNGFFTCFD